jgi:outer membrane protein assembly factor BamB
VVTCYEAATGKQVYRERIGCTNFAASPVAADGRLYFVSEQGEVQVIKAGPTFEPLAANDMGAVCHPAISRGALFVRTQYALFALGGKPSGR